MTCAVLHDTEVGPIGRANALGEKLESMRPNVPSTLLELLSPHEHPSTWSIQWTHLFSP